MLTTMNSLGQWDELAEALRDELAEYGGLLSLLDQQRDAIVTRSMDALLEANEQVQEQIAMANQNRLSREQICSRLALEQGIAGDTPITHLIVYMPVHARPMFEALNDEATGLIGKVREKSQRNSALLSRATELNEKVIGIVSPGSTTKTYNARGGVYLKSVRSRGNGIDMSA